MTTLLKPAPLPLSEFVAAARGAVPADLVLKNARIVNVLTGEIHEETVGERATAFSASVTTMPHGRTTRST